MTPCQDQGQLKEADLTELSLLDPNFRKPAQHIRRQELVVEGVSESTRDICLGERESSALGGKGTTGL